MAITFIRHLQNINDALYDLIRAEFTGISIRNFPFFEIERFGKFREYIRFHYMNDELVSTNSDGETRDFSYDISIYLQYYEKEAKEEFEELIANRVDRLTKLLCQTTTYTVDGIYIWHDPRIITREFTIMEDQTNIVEIKLALVLTRTTMWVASTLYGVGYYGITVYT